MLRIVVGWTTLVGSVQGARFKRNADELSRSEEAEGAWSHGKAARGGENSSYGGGSNGQILCPVLAAMHRAGDLQTDAQGNFELGQLYDGLHEKLGIASSLSQFQSYGIVAFSQAQKGIEQHRERCLPPTRCFTKRFLGGIVDSSTQRFLNVYTMNGKQTIEHAISTGVRGGDTNMPPNAINCQGRYPCAARFEQFFGSDRSKRFYLKDIMRVVCLARQIGDRGGEHAYAKEMVEIPGVFSFSPKGPGREWQMKGAMGNALYAFGSRDAAGDIYLKYSDLQALFLEGRYPDGWQRREHLCLVKGCEKSAISLFNHPVECEVDEDDPWWRGTGCEVFTGRTCGSCGAGQTCVGGKCMCDRGANLRSMCFRGGACREQADDGYSFFGAPRNNVAADNPSPRGNP